MTMPWHRSLHDTTYNKIFFKFLKEQVILNAHKDKHVYNRLELQISLRKSLRVLEHEEDNLLHIQVSLDTLEIHD
jgi:hypothetical protein